MRPPNATEILFMSQHHVNADVTYRRRRLATSVSVYRDWLSDFITVGPATKINTVTGVVNIPPNRTSP